MRTGFGGYTKANFFEEHWNNVGSLRSPAYRVTPLIRGSTLMRWIISSAAIPAS